MTPVDSLSFMECYETAGRIPDGDAAGRFAQKSAEIVCVCSKKPSLKNSPAQIPRSRNALEPRHGWRAGTASLSVGRLAATGHRSRMSLAHGS